MYYYRVSGSVISTINPIDLDGYETITEDQFNNFTNAFSSAVIDDDPEITPEEALQFIMGVLK